ncbi:MAG TPA: hypothetical protein VKU90_14575 [Caulobacteraceae bacterium]|nr:hypothetical protein [Caulobacteraceae bacterium]
MAAFVATIAAAGAALAVPSAPPAPPIPPEALAAGMKEAPPLVQAAGIPCTVVAARAMGTGKGTDGSKVTLYEVACQQGMGYVVTKSDKSPTPTAFDCLMAATPSPDGKPSSIVCRLPQNANPAAGIQPIVAATGRVCTVSAARFLGLLPDKTKLYEVACQGGTGFVLQMPPNGATVANNCLAYATGAAKCTLTTADQNMAIVPALAQSSGKCTPTKQRYVLSTPDESDYFEVSCSDGKGYMLQADRTGKLAGVIPCTQAYQIGDGCTLTDARQAESQEDSLYSGLAKQAGFDCTVSKYALFPQSDASKDIVEMVCSNRPDGGVGIFPAHGTGHVYDCLRSQDQGFKCTFTQVSAVFPKLSAELQAKGKGSCKVSDARPFGHADDGSDLIEVACADGGSGWVMMFPAGSQTPTDLLNCGQVAGTNGGCQLSTNKKG